MGLCDTSRGNLLTSMELPKFTALVEARSAVAIRWSCGGAGPYVMASLVPLLAAQEVVARKRATLHGAYELYDLDFRGQAVPYVLMAIPGYSTVTLTTVAGGTPVVDRWYSRGGSAFYAAFWSAVGRFSGRGVPGEYGVDEYAASILYGESPPPPRP